MGFISRSCFESDDFIAYLNEWDWREKPMFIHSHQTFSCRIRVSTDSQFFAQRALEGVKRSGAWGLTQNIHILTIYFLTYGVEKHPWFKKILHLDHLRKHNVWISLSARQSWHDKKCEKFSFRFFRKSTQIQERSIKDAINFL